MQPMLYYLIKFQKHNILKRKNSILKTSFSILAVFKSVIKWTDRLCKAIKLSMQHCGQILKDSFETYKTFPRFIITEFERKVDVQNHELW